MSVQEAALRQLDHVWAADARRRGVVLGPGSRLSGRPVVSLEPGSSIEIGEGFFAQSRPRYQVLAVAHPCVLRTVHTSARLRIGRDCGMSGGSIVCASSITIGDGVLLGADVAIFDTNFHPVVAASRRFAPMPQPRPRDAIRIGSNVFIGTGAVVLPGTTIGDDCVIGARALVRGEIPAGSIVAGPSATVVGSTRRRPADR